MSQYNHYSGTNGQSPDDPYGSHQQSYNDPYGNTQNNDPEYGQSNNKGNQNPQDMQFTQLDQQQFVPVELIKQNSNRRSSQYGGGPEQTRQSNNPFTFEAGQSKQIEQSSYNVQGGQRYNSNQQYYPNMQAPNQQRYQSFNHNGQPLYQQQMNSEIQYQHPQQQQTSNSANILNQQNLTMVAQFAQKYGGELQRKLNENPQIQQQFNNNQGRQSHGVQHNGAGYQEPFLPSRNDYQENSESDDYLKQHSYKYMPMIKCSPNTAIFLMVAQIIFLPFGSAFAICCDGNGMNEEMFKVFLVQMVITIVCSALHPVLGGVSSVVSMAIWIWANVNTCRIYEYNKKRVEMFESDGHHEETLGNQQRRSQG